MAISGRIKCARLSSRPSPVEGWEGVERNRVVSRPKRLVSLDVFGFLRILFPGTGICTLDEEGGPEKELVEFRELSEGRRGTVGVIGELKEGMGDAMAGEPGTGEAGGGDSVILLL